MSDRATKVLEVLEFMIAPNFVQDVTAHLRRLSDREVNELYLKTHTDWHHGDDVHVWTAVLMPIIEREVELRDHINVVPWIGPVVAPDLYQKGGGHDAPF